MERGAGAELSLVLFFTRGVSLADWEQAGNLDREVALYRRLQSRGVRVTFVTYGGRSEERLRSRLPGIEICCNRWHLPARWYERLIPILHRKALRRCHLVKTNQMPGADVALAAARLWKKPFLARCGYLWSKNLALEHGAGAPLTRLSLAVEEEVFTAAHAISLTAPAMVAAVGERFPQLRGRIALVPNYVDTDSFAPSGCAAATPRLCFVGRLEKEKNLAALIEAVAGLDLELEIIGQGSLREELARLCAGNPRVRLLGSVAHGELPGHLARCALFVLPSLYEGHPKALLEAMACGVPVLGTDVSGINEVISHGENGWLCAGDAASLREAIVTLLGDRALRERIGCAGAAYIRERLSLDRIVERELELYRVTVGRAGEGG